MNIPKENEGAAAGAPEGPRARQDLSFLWPVIDRISAVEIKFNGDASPEHDGGAVPAVSADVESRLAKLEAEIAAIKEVVQNAAGMLTAVQAASADVPDEAPEYAPHTWQGVAAAIAMSVVLLLLAHWLIVVVYDLRLIVLRLASIAIPLAIGLAFTLRRRIELRYEVPIALAIAVIAVFGMSYVTSVVEKSSWLPENAREWHETLEYMASIAFAYLTGVLASSAWQAHVGRSSGRVGETTLRMARQLAKVTGQALETGTKVGKQVKTIHDVINTVMPAATAVISVVTGVSSVLK